MLLNFLRTDFLYDITIYNHTNTVSGHFGFTISIPTNVYENIVLPVELDGDTVDQKFLDKIVHLLGLTKRTSTEFLQTVVMFTHNNDIARIADRIIRIEDSKIVE